MTKAAKFNHGFGRQGWHVIDTDGGVWWPNADAEEEITVALDPEARAIEVCEQQPMRGVWES